MVQKIQNYNKYYLPYVPRAKINYIYLFYLYGIAERNYSDIKEKIDYKTIVELLGKINEKGEVIKYSTLQRLLADKKKQYKEYKNKWGSLKRTLPHYSERYEGSACSPHDLGNAGGGCTGSEDM